MNNEVLAVVAGEEITEKHLDAFVQNLPQEQRRYASHPQFREQCIEQIVAMRSFAKLGENLKLDETEAFREILESARKDILSQLAIREIFKDINITEDDIRTFYTVNAQQFQKGATVSAKHILVAEEEQCKEILAALENGEKTFEEAAQAHSTCPSGQRGGDLGEFGRGQMVKEFEEAAFAAEIGAVVGPVKTQFGYHLIKVEKRNEASIAPVEEVKEQIRKTLVQQKQNQLYSEKLAELKEKYFHK